MKAEPTLLPRALDREGAAVYLSVSVDTIDRLVSTGRLSIVRLPVTRHRNGAAVAGQNRRILLDRLELDALVDAGRERRGPDEPSAGEVSTCGVGTCHAGVSTPGSRR